MKKILLILTLLLPIKLLSSTLLIPMDESQKEHLKAYGVCYWLLNKGVEADWLLNYRGGSFAAENNNELEKECILRGVSYEVIPSAQYQNILRQIADPEVNMDLIKLQKPPKIAVYSPKNKLPWDDAVTMVLTYAEIPYDIIYDDEILDELTLAKYDWLHIHHEDFTGQYGKFYGAYANAQWYKDDQQLNEECARRHGFSKVSQLKLAVAKRIKEFVAGGGFLFAMCSATDSYDIALAAEGKDICEAMFDGDGTTPGAAQKLNFTNGIAFENYHLEMNPYVYEYSDIDATNTRQVPMDLDYFTLFDFSAKWDPVPTMLCQDHIRTIKGFMGQTTAYKSAFVKKNVLIMGENKPAAEARYIHGELGKGTWTFFGGHDPEDYQHLVGDPKTDLSLHPNSPGYRLILNNVLFPAAKKKKQKT
jgi:hypothetical protein